MPPICNRHQFYDIETGIFIYAFGVGQSTCTDETMFWRDPHANVQRMEEWSYTVAIGDIEPKLAPGRYWFTIKAYNNIIRGGPLSTTVCDSIPLVIDITKPDINELNLGYDDDTRNIMVDYNITDDLSDLKAVFFGLGLSSVDEALMPFEKYYNRSRLVLYNPNVPQGVFMFGRVRAINNVDLSRSGTGPKPLFLDYSSPYAGIVRDGFDPGVDLTYTYQNDRFASNWEGFRDPESGIDHYQWAVGRGMLINGSWVFELLNNTVEWYNISGQSTRFQMLLDFPLEHNTMYIATVIAYNGGHLHQANSSTSNGVLIDRTCPSFQTDENQEMQYANSIAFEGDPLFACHCPCSSCFSSEFGMLCERGRVDSLGYVRDGLDEDYKEDEFGQWHDLEFTAFISKAEAVWDGFEDPESTVARYEVAIGRLDHALRVMMTSVRPFVSVGLAKVFRDNSLYLSDGDYIVQTVRAVNLAGQGTIVTTNGFKIDR